MSSQKAGLTAHLAAIKAYNAGRREFGLRRGDADAREGQYSHRRRDFGGSIADPRRASRILRSGRELSRRARCLSRQRPCRHRVPPGRRRGDDGGGGRQGDRPARCLFCHARARRHQCFARHSHRASGFDAARHVCWPSGTRHARARGVSGNRLSRHVRLDDQVGDRDRGPGAHTGNRLTRFLYGGERPAGAGRRQPARGHADRACRRR